MSLQAAAENGQGGSSSYGEVIPPLGNEGGEALQSGKHSWEARTQRYKPIFITKNSYVIRGSSSKGHNQLSNNVCSVQLELLYRFIMLRSDKEPDADQGKSRERYLFQAKSKPERQRFVVS